MKKLLALLLAVVMVLGLVACGSKTEEPAPAAEPEQSTTEPAAAETEEPEAPAEEPEAPAEEPAADVSADIKIGAILVHDENSGYDMAHIEGLTQACQELGIPMENVTFKYNIPEDETCYDTAADLADAGCDIIFSDSYGHQTHMGQAAAEFPDTIFVACTGDLAAGSGLSNLKNIFPYTYESRYVSGVVAGMKLKELLDDGSVTDPYVGYVGAYPYAEVVSGYTAFLLGIQSIVPEAHMDVQYTNSWYDPVAEGEAANALMGRGCVIIGQHADSTGAPSAVQAAFDSGKVVYSVGYNIDMLAVAPEAALTSAQNVWAVLYKATLEKFMAGEEIPTDFACGAADGAVKISALGSSCAEGTQEAVDAAWAGLKDGSLHVFDTSKFTCQPASDGSYVVDENGTVTSAFGLDSNGDWVNDCGEAIVNGYFEESVLRSAPYFALRIDGITELN